MKYYYSLSDYFKTTHGNRIWRLPLSTQKFCPHRINGNTGCSFCDGESFLPEYLRGQNYEDLDVQLELGKNFFGNRNNINKFYGYFQSNTNTYGDMSKLIIDFEHVLKKDYIYGLIISTRPDYVYKDIIVEIEKLRKKYNKDLWIELGLQSSIDSTLNKINRGHDYKCFKDTIKLIKDNSKAKITVHMISGLPDETPEQTEEATIKLFKENQIDGIKIRVLDIIPNTPIEKDIKSNKYKMTKFTVDTFVTHICNIIERIPKNVVIMRFANFKSLDTSNYQKEKVTKGDIINEVEKELARRNSYQGKYYE